MDKELMVHPPLTLTFILRGAAIHTVAITDDLKPYAPMWSYVYFCPMCGEEWGRVVRSDHGERKDLGVRFDPVARYCDRHDENVWFETLAGCFMPHLYVEPTFPREILLRDFLRLMSIKEKHRVSAI